VSPETIVLANLPDAVVPVGHVYDGIEGVVRVHVSPDLVQLVAGHTAGSVLLQVAPERVNPAGHIASTVLVQVVPDKVYPAGQFWTKLAGV